MIPSVQEVKTFDFAPYLPAILTGSRQSYGDIYEQNRHRLYALAFWMTDHELAAEELMGASFCRAFSQKENPSAEEIDSALVAELREQMPLGELTLSCGPVEKVLSVRYNILRVDLERAVVQLPSTEKMIFLMHDVEGYAHQRIARALQISEDTSRLGLHQARLRMRELLAK